LENKVLATITKSECRTVGTWINKDDMGNEPCL